MWHVAGVGGIPATGVVAVGGTITVTNPDGDGWLTVHEMVHPWVLEEVARAGHRRVFDLGGDDAPAAGFCGRGRPTDGYVAGLGSAGGEDDLVGFRADEPRDLSAGLVDRLTGSLAERVVAGGVAVLLRQVRQHGVEHLGVDWSGGVVVEVVVAIRHLLAGDRAGDTVADEDHLHVGAVAFGERAVEAEPVVGQERTVLPLLAQEEFGLTAFSSTLTFIAAFGVVKAATNFIAGTLSDRFGREPVLVAGWLIAIPVPLL
jgi:hypothetical protein